MINFLDGEIDIDWVKIQINGSEERKKLIHFFKLSNEHWINKTNQIKLLKKTKVNSEEENEINLKIQNYQRELNKIKEKFPENYFDEFDSS